MVTEKKVAWSPESFGWFNNNLLMSMGKSELLYLVAFPLSFTALLN